MVVCKVERIEGKNKEAMPSQLKSNIDQTWEADDRIITENKL